MHRFYGTIEQWNRKANKTLGLQQVMPDDLHRPYIDGSFWYQKWETHEKGKPILIDVWFDSGSMPYTMALPNGASVLYR